MSHYFETPTGPTRAKEVTARIWGRDYRFASAGGVFSADGLDHATALLFDTFAPPRTAGRLLDLGCGWGPIAVALAQECPEAIVDAVDVNELAVQLTRENAERCGVADRVVAGTPDDPAFTRRAEDGRYDEIWSNPPLRIGKEELHTLLRHWLPRLADDGRARFVVGRNLGADSLQRWLIEQGWPTRRVGSAKGFRLFEISRPVL